MKQTIDVTLLLRERGLAFRGFRNVFVTQIMEIY